MKWAVPPRAKVLEALGAIGDGRVKLADNHARVGSSMGDREYTVEFDLASKRIVADDNGSKYKGYMGYPSVAVLMLKGLLPFDERLAEALKGIPWKDWNEKFKNYWRTEIETKKKLAEHGISGEELDSFIAKVLEEVEKEGFHS